MTIYVDIVLLENLCMNYIILFSTAYVLKLKRKHIRIIISSLIGAIYAILAYAEIIPIYTNVIVKIILSATMIFVAFNPKYFKAMLKELIVFYLISFALGGCAFALLYIVKPQEIFMKNGVYIGTYPLKIAILGGILGFAITYISFKIVKSRVSKNEIIYKVLIKLEEKNLQLNVLLDTGLMAKDPISGAPIILIEKEKMKEILPEELLQNVQEMWGGELKNDLSLEYKKRLRIIPFNSVGKQNGMMLGIKVDEVKIITDVDEVINNNVIVCVYDKKFSKSNKYFGLIGLDILEQNNNIVAQKTIKH